MVGLKPQAYAKQIAIYLQKKAIPEAYELAEKYAKTYPKDGTAHYLLAMCAYEMKDYRESAQAGRKAFNFAQIKEDMVAGALIAACGYYRTEEYEKGCKLLQKMEEIKDSPEVEEMLVCFSIAMRDEKAILAHVKKLLDLNKKAGERMLLKILESNPPRIGD